MISKERIEEWVDSKVFIFFNVAKVFFSPYILSSFPSLKFYAKKFQFFRKTNGEVESEGRLLEAKLQTTAINSLGYYFIDTRV